MASKFIGNTGRGTGDQGPCHAAPPAVETIVNQEANVNRSTTASRDEPQRNATEPHALKVFKTQRAGKAKVEEGQSAEGKENPSAFDAISQATTNLNVLQNFFVIYVAAQIT
jgi:hypothetical protein